MSWSIPLFLLLKKKNNKQDRKGQEGGSVRDTEKKVCICVERYDEIW